MLSNDFLHSQQALNVLQFFLCFRMFYGQIQVVDQAPFCLGRHSKYSVLIELFEMNWRFIRFIVVLLVELLRYLVAHLNDFLPLRAMHSNVLILDFAIANECFWSMCIEGKFQLIMRCCFLFFPHLFHHHLFFESRWHSVVVGRQLWFKNCEIPLPSWNFDLDLLFFTFRYTTVETQGLPGDNSVENNRRLQLTVTLSLPRPRFWFLEQHGLFNEHTGCECRLSLSQWGKKSLMPFPQSLGIHRFHTGTRQVLPHSFQVSLSEVFFLVLYILSYLFWFVGIDLTNDFPANFVLPLGFPLYQLDKSLPLCECCAKFV